MQAIEANDICIIFYSSTQGYISGYTYNGSPIFPNALLIGPIHLLEMSRYKYMAIIKNDFSVWVWDLTQISVNLQTSAKELCPSFKISEILRVSISELGDLKILNSAGHIVQYNRNLATWMLDPIDLISLLRLSVI